MAKNYAWNPQDYAKNSNINAVLPDLPGDLVIGPPYRAPPMMAQRLHTPGDII